MREGHRGESAAVTRRRGEGEVSTQAQRDRDAETAARARAYGQTGGCSPVCLTPRKPVSERGRGPYLLGGDGTLLGAGGQGWLGWGGDSGDLLLERGTGRERQRGREEKQTKKKRSNKHRLMEFRTLHTHT